MKALMKKFLPVTGFLMFSGVASASDIATDDNFGNFATTMENMANSGFAVAISIIALLVGGVVGLVKMSAMPPLIGIAFAVVFKYGPVMIKNIILGNGAVI